MNEKSPSIEDLFIQAVGAMKAAAEMMKESENRSPAFLPEDFEAIVHHEQLVAAGQAKANIEKWGLQTPETLILAIAEQTGKLSQAFLHCEFEPEKYTPGQMLQQTRHTSALLLQLSILQESNDI